MIFQSQIWSWRNKTPPAKSVKPKMKEH